MFSQKRSRLSKQNKQNQNNMPYKLLSVCFSMTILPGPDRNSWLAAVLSVGKNLPRQLIDATFFINC
ncbi:hypothetical protein EHS86_00060 [Erwinia amylovora]|nr:hypothetical protein AD997_06805 [Erwinia amylovora]CCO85772.1 hypothetical protein BN434_1373 [Erwinia amylovora CFBP 2585]CCO98668.1 hypothetical protein BN438_1375 [Erwinia amylovora UPN527]QJQ54951.1 hypothetical protein EHX00_2249 [Erwinia amylovora]QJQ58650.1 hypothetical protein EHW99_2249 [Erwinia amylovora]